VAALNEVSLVTLETLDDGSPGISVHRLVQAVMRGRLREMKEHENVAALATELVEEAFPSSSHARSWPDCERLGPHALALLLLEPVSANRKALEKKKLLRDKMFEYDLSRKLTEADRLVFLQSPKPRFWRRLFGRA